MLKNKVAVEQTTEEESSSRTQGFKSQETETLCLDWALSENLNATLRIKFQVERKNHFTEWISHFSEILSNVPSTI